MSVDKHANGVNNRIAFVTGGSRGIGAAICRYLAKKGARVAFTYQQSQESAETLAEEICTENGVVMALRMESSDRDSAYKAIKCVRDKWGDVDILVNNAALSQEKPFIEISDNDWDRMLAVNLRGPFVCTQEVIPAMVSKGYGRIINISSIGGQWGGYNQVHYAAAKAGLINLTRSIAKIYSKNGITCNAIAPGLVETDMIKNELVTIAGQEKIRSIPVGRIASCEEIASAVFFLASEEASYITGQTISINGGMYFS
ncbi:MAG: 3-oxoacyl-ACP reductase family protein [Desulfuromonadales bacterium]